MLGGYIGFTPPVHPPVRPSARPPVRPASGVRSVAPTVLVGSISYLYILSSKFRRCVVFKITYTIVKWILILAIFLTFVTFYYVLFWLGSWCESLAWVIMGRRGVSQNAGVLVVLVIPGLTTMIIHKHQSNSHELHLNRLLHVPDCFTVSTLCTYLSA